MLVLLFTACTSVAGADPSEYEYGDWEELAQRIQVLDDEGDLIDSEPIITPPAEVVEPDNPLEETAPEEAE